MLVMSQKGNLMIKNELVAMYQIVPFSPKAFMVYAYDGMTTESNSVVMARYTNRKQAVNSLKQLMRASLYKNDYEFPTDNPKWGEK